MTKFQLKLNGPFNDLLKTKQARVMFLLVSLVLLQSVGVIYTKQTQRLLHAKIQSLYTARDKLQIEWSKLLIEQGIFQSEAHVETIARDRLGMVVPEKIDVIKP